MYICTKSWPTEIYRYIGIDALTGKVRNLNIQASA